jgi:hypothetical protein
MCFNIAMRCDGKLFRVSKDIRKELIPNDIFCIITNKSMTRRLYFDTKGFLLTKYFDLPKITNDCIDDPHYLRYKPDPLIQERMDNILTGLNNKVSQIKLLLFLEALNDLVKGGDNK